MIGNETDAAFILAWHHNQPNAGKGDDRHCQAPEGWEFLGQGISRGAYSKGDVTYKVTHWGKREWQSSGEVANVERVRSIKGLPCYVPAASEYHIGNCLVVAMETCPGERGVFQCDAKEMTFSDSGWGYWNDCVCPGKCRWIVQREIEEMTGIEDIHLFNVLVETIFNDDGSWGNEIYYLIDLG